MRKHREIDSWDQQRSVKRSLSEPANADLPSAVLFFTEPKRSLNQRLVVNLLLHLKHKQSLNEAVTKQWLPMVCASW